MSSFQLASCLNIFVITITARECFNWVNLISVRTDHINQQTVNLFKGCICKQIKALQGICWVKYAMTWPWKLSLPSSSASIKTEWGLMNATHHLEECYCPPLAKTGLCRWLERHFQSCRVLDSVLDKEAILMKVLTFTQAATVKTQL